MNVFSKNDNVSVMQSRNNENYNGGFYGDYFDKFIDRNNCGPRNQSYSAITDIEKVVG